MEEYGEAWTPSQQPEDKAPSAANDLRGNQDQLLELSLLIISFFRTWDIFLETQV